MMVDRTNTSREQFLQLLHGFVHESSLKLNVRWNTESLWKIAAQQNMLPVLAYENKKWRSVADR